MIEKFRPEAFKKETLKIPMGMYIGVHDGIVNFTIGQRKGIKIAAKNPLYVIKLMQH